MGCLMGSPIWMAIDKGRKCMEVACHESGNFAPVGRCRINRTGYLIAFIKLFGSQSDLPQKLAWSFVLVEFPIMGLLFWSIARSHSAQAHFHGGAFIGEHGSSSPMTSRPRQVSAAHSWTSAQSTARTIGPTKSPLIP